MHRLDYEDWTDMNLNIVDLEKLLERNSRRDLSDLISYPITPVEIRT
jgi:hypothetical protein